MTKTLGIDVSHHQGLMNWQTALNAGAKFAVIRAGSINVYGEVYTDNRWNENITNAPHVYREYYNADGYPGLASYWYFRPQFSRVAQAYHWLSLISPIDMKKHYLDVEVTGGLDPGALALRIKEMLDLMADNLGFLPGIYTRQSFWDPYVAPRSYWSDYDLFIARYAGWLDHPWGDGKYKPRDWMDYKLWQWSADGNERGSEFGASSPHIDIDYFNGDENKLKKYFDVAEPAPEPPIEPEPPVEPEIPEINNMKWHRLNFYPLVGVKFNKNGIMEVPFEGLPKNTHLVYLVSHIESDHPDNYISFGLDGRMIVVKSDRPSAGFVPINREKTFMTYYVKKGSTMRVWMMGWGCLTQS